MNELDTRTEYWKRHYDELGAGGERLDWPSGRMFVETTATVLKLVGDVRGKRVLDAGCGLGHLAVAISLFGAEEVVAFDYAASLIDTCRTMHHDEGGPANCVRFEVADLTDASTFAWGLFDIVTCVEALHAVPTSDALVRLWGTVRAGGRLVAVLPNCDSPITDAATARNDGVPYFGLGRAALDPTLRRLSGLTTWRIGGLHLADDQRVEIYDSRRLDVTDDPPPYSWVLTAIRGR